MLWDGAYQFSSSVVSGRSFCYLSRFHSWVVWQPMTLLAAHSSGLVTLKLAYAAPFCFAPLAGAGLSWWVVRERAPHTMLWALLGMAGALLPGQIFMINDSIFQFHLFWPVFLASLLPLRRRQTLIIAIVSLFQLSHPIGIGLCALTAGVAGGQAYRQRSRTGFLWAGWMAALALGGIWKLALWPDNYAASEASWAQVMNTFLGGVIGWPLAGLLLVWAAAGLLSWNAFGPSPANPRRFQWALGLIALAGACWWFWAAEPYRWLGAVSYRRWIAPLSFPLLVAAGLELWRRTDGGAAPAPAVTRERGLAGVAVAAVFLLVLGTQSLETHRLLGRLARELAACPTPWLPESALGWVHGTALDHWGLPAQVLVAQGREPRVLLWNADAATAAAAAQPSVVLSPFDFKDPSASPRSWFHWGDLPAPPPAGSPHLAHTPAASGFAPN